MERRAFGGRDGVRARSQSENRLASNVDLSSLPTNPSSLSLGVLHSASSSVNAQLDACTGF